MSYRSGYQAIQATMERASERSDGFDYGFISWKDKDRKVIRLLTDNVVTIGFHDYVRCLDGKNRSFTCAKELNTPRACYICDNVTTLDDDNNAIPSRPRQIGIGLAALRNEVQGGGIEDVLEKDDKGNSHPSIGIVSQSVSNFWGNLNGYFVRYGTTIDRDYEITRVGKDQTTHYTVIHCDKVEGLADADDIAKHYAITPDDLIESYIENMGTESRYSRLVIGTAENNPTPQPAAEAAAPQQGSIPGIGRSAKGDSEGIDALRAKLISRRQVDPGDGGKIPY